MSTEQLQILIDKYLDDSLSSHERSRLCELLADPEYAEQFKNIISHELSARRFELEPDEQVGAAIKSFVAGHIQSEDDSVRPVHRVHFLRRNWLKYAAAIIILFGVGAYLFTTSKETDQPFADNKQRQTDVPPGGNRAILTLADGTTIILDSAANGNLAQQGNAQVVKLGDGQIAYNLKGNAGGVVNMSAGNLMLNTMSTPNGGQYQLTLPDGTRVWLNAASSITYPAAFVSNKRQVKITGEVYFEVAKNKAKPFLVDIDGKSLIEVLGTSFNVNSYKDEGSIKATLVEGSVRVVAGNKPAILKPGYQAIVVSSDQRSESQSEIQIQSADLSQALAWKNGLFNFEGLDLEAVMRQLERWYDINVQYKGSESDLIFHGKMYRNVNLSYVLEMLKEMGVKFELRGQNLIVL